MNPALQRFCEKLAGSGFWDAAAQAIGTNIGWRAEEAGTPVWQTGPQAGTCTAFPVSGNMQLLVVAPGELLPPQRCVAAFVARAFGQGWQDAQIQRGLSQETLKRYREGALVLKAAIAFNGLLEPEAIVAELLGYFQKASGAAVLDAAGKVVVATGCLQGSGMLAVDFPPRPHLRNGPTGMGWQAYLWYPLETVDGLSLLIVSDRPELTFDSVDLQKVSVLAQLARAALNTASQFQARQTLSRYMAPAVVEKLLQDHLDVLGGVEQDATVLFADIRNFTTLTARLGAQETVACLNRYFSAMVGIVQQEHGIVDKFLGDGLLAVFGVPFPLPDAAGAAVRAGQGMLEAAARLDWPVPLQIGIGISSGTVIAGNIGSVERMEYTVIGDAVNQAAKLQDIIKANGHPLVLTETTLQRLDPLFQKRCVPVRQGLQGMTVYTTA